MPLVRPAAVAGQFYEGEREALIASIASCFRDPLGPGALPEVDPQGPGEVGALVSPHAGYVYSGPAAACGFRALASDGIPQRIIIVGPSHYSLARRAAVSLAESWRTPLGDAPVDVDFGRALIAASPLVEEDERVHRDEHSIEVQVPFLQFLYGEQMPPITPICLRSHPMTDLDQVVNDAASLGQTLAELAEGRRVVVVASTDFSHQIPHEAAQRHDRLALDQIEALDPEGLLRTVQRHRISMCGPVPVAVALAFCLARGPHQAETLCAYTSGEVTGENRAVVGYASVLIRRRRGRSP